jgi:hypothetical protein
MQWRVFGHASTMYLSARLSVCLQTIATARGRLVDVGAAAEAADTIAKCAHAIAALKSIQ